jgi:hypothetical protein
MLRQVLRNTTLLPWLAPEQGNQMSLLKIAQNVVTPIFVKIDFNLFCHGKSSQKIGSTYLI